MAVQDHMMQLSHKHRMLDRRIADERNRPSADEIEIARLKLEKLKLKDQIAKLEAATRH